MKSRVKFLFVTLLIVIISLALIEVASRATLKVIYNREFDSSLIVDNKYFTSPGLKENADGLVWGKKFHIDEFGGRKNAKSNRDKKKWLFIGDSVTEGVGVGDSAAFASLCSQEFSDFNLINLSLIGYSSHDYVNVLKSFLAKDSSVELVTLFYCLNDVYGESKTKDLPVMAKQNFIGALNAFLQDRCATYKWLKLLVYQNSASYFKYDTQFYSRDNSRFIQSMNDLRECDSICQARNVFFQVVMLPYKSQLLENSQHDVPQELVKEFCKQDSIEFSDAMPFLTKQEAVQSLYLFADEIHFSAKGHRVIADYLSQ
jgi:lysophospholipase L1-like esterase